MRPAQPGVCARSASMSTGLMVREAAGAGHAAVPVQVGWQHGPFRRLMIFCWIGRVSGVRGGRPWHRWQSRLVNISWRRDKCEVAVIHHVQLACPAGTEDALRRFYGGVLGFSEVAKPPVLA